jgi:hypothetical protein
MLHKKRGMKQGRNLVRNYFEDQADEGNDSDPDDYDEGQKNHKGKTEDVYYNPNQLKRKSKGLDKDMVKRMEKKYQEYENQKL